MNFNKRTAVVTGAGGPMGRAIVARLVAGGISGLALNDISNTRLQQTVESLPADLPVLAFRGDMAQSDEANGFAQQVLAKFGVADMLVNVVGGLRSRKLYTPILEMDADQLHATLDLNLMGLFNLSKALVPGMLEQRWGRIVNFATIVYGGEAGQADYAAAKAAVASFSRSMAAEFAPYVTVNTIAPGVTRTSVTENLSDEEVDRLTSLAMNKRMAEPDETADAVAYFLSEGARFVTGEMLSVSGGVRPHL